MSKGKKKHTVRTIGISVLIVILAGAAALGLWQADNIKAVINAKKYTTQQRAEMKKQNDDAIQKIIDSVPEAVDLKPLDSEEEKALQSGQLSEDEALQIIMGASVNDAVSGKSSDDSGSKQESTQSENKNQTTDKTENTDRNNTENTQSSSAQNGADSGSAQSQDSAQLKKLFARVYLLRSNFTGRLNSLIAQAKAEISSPEAEGNALSIANKYYGMGTALEGECDAQMYSLLSQINDELVRTGGDTSVVSQIKTAYQNEKSLTKSALMDKYKK